MDILFLCHRIPFPPNKGDKIRSHALLTHLAKSHRVHVGCFVDEPGDMDWADEVRRIAGGECVFVPLNRSAKWVGAAKAILTRQPITTAYLYAPVLDRWITQLAQSHRVGATVVFSSGMAAYVLRNPALDPKRAILDLVDVDSDKWRQYSALLKPPQSWIFQREATELERFERLAASRFAATLLVSDYEARTFSTIAHESASRIGALTNGVDLDYFAPGDFPNPFVPGETPIVMTGRMDYRPNVDAVRWFYREVFPDVKAALPGARFHAVGACPPPAWRQIRSEDFVVTEQVRDIRPYIGHAAVIVAPLRIARGVQNKVLEAMAMAKSIVATHAATRALGVSNGFDILIENEPHAFARAVVEATSRKDIAEQARRYVVQHHDWRRNMAVLDACIHRIAGGASNELTQPISEAAE